jgi:hypothetical protein
VVGRGDNKGIDFKTNGGIVVVAPSIHKSGRKYCFLKIDPLLHGLDDLLDLPDEVITHFKGKGVTIAVQKALTLEPVERGERNDTLARLVGKWIGQGLDFQTVCLTAKGWNRELQEPLDEKEVRTTVESIFRTHERNHPDRTIETEKSLDFPSHVIQGAAGYYANVLNEYSEAPQQFTFMAYLTLLGGAISPCLKIKTFLDTQPRLYTVLVGESALARKSTIINKTVKHFKSNIIDFNVRYGIGSPEGLQKIVGSTATVSLKPSGILLVFDEFKAFVDKAAIKNSVLLPCINTLFEINIYENVTKNNHINIQNAHISMLAATTKLTYETIYDDKFTRIGFPNRVFLVPGSSERKFSIPPEIPESEENKLNQNLIQILKHVGDNMALDLTPEAKSIYHDWYMNRVEQSVHALRLDTYSIHTCRLLLIIISDILLSPMH